MKRLLGILALLVGAVALGVGSAGLAGVVGPAGVAAAAKGNNGVIKIDGYVVGGGGNVPHIGCPFTLSFWGFDPGTQSATVGYTAQPPSGTGPVAPTTGPSAFTFSGGGSGSTLNTSKTYVLDVTGLTYQPQQGYHITLDVTVTHANNIQTKSKTFWYQPCSPPPPTTTTVPATTTTVPATTTTVPATTTTTLPGTTTTTVPGTTTTVPATTTTLAPVPGGGPNAATTTTSTTLPGTSPGASPGAATSPAANTTPAASTTPAAGTAPASAGAAAGPAPSGAGTDLGFFQPTSWAGASKSPWLLMIAGGALLLSVGAISTGRTRHRRGARSA